MKGIPRGKILYKEVRHPINHCVPLSAKELEQVVEKVLEIAELEVAIKELEIKIYRFRTSYFYEQVMEYESEIKKLRDKLKDINEHCTHGAIWDEQCFPYDIRTCVICGTSNFI